TNVNRLELQVSVPGSPDVGTLFGYDHDNTVSLDNIKVMELVPRVSPPGVGQTNGQARAGVGRDEPMVSQAEQPAGHEDHQQHTRFTSRSLRPEAAMAGVLQSPP
ncbi:MAG TPA: hypothetical protein VL970_04140, partial [Candidatus Acidoferrales bacterium]|nr:hypothetical protein [Candidatus Acidoferrales bacterium]